MSVSDKTAPNQTDAITFELALNHPPERVWRALTDPALLSEWLLPVVGLRLDVGAAFSFHTAPHPGWDGAVQCRVLDVVPNEKLQYTWMVGDMALDTVVTFTLAATPTGSRLTVVQSGFKPSQKQNFGGARYGWKLMGARLVAQLDASADA